ncbi:MAG: DUF262 domain-containing protein [bacterium]
MANFEVNNVSISTLLGYVTDGTIAIPEIQRPFVWDTKKVRDLVDSLYKGYPVGYIITWKSANIKLKDGSSSEGKQILIDGQQRITALTAAFLGMEVLNDEYKKHRVKISFNLKNESFATHTPSLENSSEWISDISLLLKEGADIYSIAKKYSDDNTMDISKVFSTIQKVQKMKNTQIGRIDIASSVDVDTVTEIFIRINSKGVSLSQADFVMSKISVNEKYEGNDIRKVIDYFCHIIKIPNDYSVIKERDVEFSSKDIFSKLSWLNGYSDNLYKPSYIDALRVSFTSKFKRGKLQDLVALLSGRDFELRTNTEEIAEESFKTLYDGVKDFINETNYKRFMMIIKSTGVIDESLIRSQNTINFAYILYLLLKEKQLQPEKMEKIVRQWFILSILTQRYSSSPESQFDSDVRRFNEVDNIEEYVKNTISGSLSDAFWDNILIDKLDTAGTNSPYWKLYMASLIKGGAKGFLSTGIRVEDLHKERGDIHHIFPKDYLVKSGINDKRRYNQIANYVLMQSEVNIQVGNKAPKDYFSILQQQIDSNETRYGGIISNDELKNNLCDNCIPNEISSMSYHEYEEFLIMRRKLMASKMKDYFNNL